MNDLDARSVLAGLIGREIHTLSGQPNRILRLDVDNVIVATGKSPEGQPVPIAWVQDALDMIVRDGEVAVNVETLRYRSAFIGAVLSTLPGAITTLRPATVRIRG